MQLADKQIVQIADSLYEGLADVQFAYIFGSAVAGNMSSTSDIDIAVYFGAGADRVKLIAKVIGMVEEIIPGRSCDLVILNEAGPLLAFEAISGRKLFVRHDAIETHAAFYSLTCRLSEDQHAWMRKQLKYRGYEV